MEMPQGSSIYNVLERCGYAFDTKNPFLFVSFRFGGMKPLLFLVQSVFPPGT